jgi:hypothetical protein
MRFVTGRLSKEELLLVYALASPAASTPEGGAAAREAEVKRLAALAVKVDSLYTLHRDVARSSRAASQRPAHHALS